MRSYRSLGLVIAVALFFSRPAPAVTRGSWLAYIETKIPAFVGSLCQSRYLLDCHKIDPAGCVTLGKKIGQDCLETHKGKLPEVLEPVDEQRGKRDMQACISSGIDRALAPKKRKQAKCTDFKAWQKANGIPRSRID